MRSPISCLELAQLLRSREYDWDKFDCEVQYYISSLKLVGHCLFGSSLSLSPSSLPRFRPFFFESLYLRKSLDSTKLCFLGVVKNALSGVERKLRVKFQLLAFCCWPWSAFYQMQTLLCKLLLWMY